MHHCADAVMVKGGVQPHGGVDPAGADNLAGIGFLHHQQIVQWFALLYWTGERIFAGLNTFGQQLTVIR